MSKSIDLTQEHSYWEGMTPLKHSSIHMEDPVPHDLEGRCAGETRLTEGSIWRNGDVNDTLRRVRWDKIHRFPEQIPEHCSHDHGGANAPQHAMILWAPDGRRSQFGITWPPEMRKELCSAETKPVQSMVHKKSPLNRNGSFLSKSFAYWCYQYNVIN